jgi:hypothetical protein
VPDHERPATAAEPLTASSAGSIFNSVLPVQSVQQSTSTEIAEITIQAKTVRDETADDDDNDEDRHENHKESGDGWEEDGMDDLDLADDEYSEEKTNSATILAENPKAEPSTESAKATPAMIDSETETTEPVIIDTLKDEEGSEESKQPPPGEEEDAQTTVTTEDGPHQDAVEDESKRRALVEEAHTDSEKVSEYFESEDKKVNEHVSQMSPQEEEKESADEGAQGEVTESQGATLPSAATLDYPESKDRKDATTPGQISMQSLAIPDNVMENFSRQMQRVEANHQEEQKLLEQEHARQIKELKVSLNHDACERARRELEEHLASQVQEREKRLSELVRLNEGQRLKLDVLKREVEGRQQLLEAKDDDIGKSNAEHSKYLKTLEQTVREKEQEAWKSKEEVKRLRVSLEESNTALEALREEHSTLKARVKLVAEELKERRVECRELGSRVVDLTEKNDRLQDSVDNLESQLTYQDRTGSDKNEEMEQLRSRLQDAATQLKKAKINTETLEAKGDKALGDYKKKAQSSLSLANSRTAAAVQAKEEAELECRAARATADTAMDRAVKAELSSKESLAKAKVYVKEMEVEKTEAVRILELKNGELVRVQSELASTYEQLQQSDAMKAKFSEELKEALGKFEGQEKNALMLQDDLLRSQERVSSLTDDVATLREALERAEEVAVTASDQPAKEQVDAKPSVNTSETDDAVRKTDEEETIRMLQQELRDANEAIEDLKEALTNAVEATVVPSDQGTLDESERSERHNTNGGGSSTPLFFAMEKQAELNTARNEINRLANLLGNVQSDKMEAQEGRNDMRTMMEAAEARLQRFEKLGANNGAPQSPGKGNALLESSSERQNGGTRSSSSGSLNIEYLKNVMLSYLNAKTLAERKALIPVIGAVLCLTADEQKHVMANAEDSVSLGGVGASLFESFGGHFTSK